MSNNKEQIERRDKKERITRHKKCKKHMGVKKSNRKEQLKPKSKQDFWGCTLNEDFEEKGKQIKQKCPCIIKLNHLGK